MTVKTEGEKGD